MAANSATSPPATVGSPASDAIADCFTQAFALIARRFYRLRSPSNSKVMEAYGVDRTHNGGAKLTFTGSANGNPTRTAPALTALH